MSKTKTTTARRQQSKPATAPKSTAWAPPALPRLGPFATQLAALRAAKKEEVALTPLAILLRGLAHEESDDPIWNLLDGVRSELNEVKRQIYPAGGASTASAYDKLTAAGRLLDAASELREVETRAQEEYAGHIREVSGVLVETVMAGDAIHPAQAIAMLERLAVEALGGPYPVNEPTDEAEPAATKGAA